MENQNNSYTNPEKKRTVLYGFYSRFQNKLLSYCIKTVYYKKKRLVDQWNKNRRIKHKYT